MTLGNDDMQDSAVEATRLSRAEIETLCILYSIGSGCDVHGLTERLGFPCELAPVVAEAVAELAETGDIAIEDDVVKLSVAGRARLDRSLSDVG